MENFAKGNPLGLKLMNQMQSEAEPEPELTGEQIENLAAMRAEQADQIANELHALGQVPGDAPPAGSMFEKWSKWAEENPVEE